MLIFWTVNGQELIRVDSILYQDLTDGTSYTTKFEYNESNLVSSIQNMEEDVDLVINYTDFNRYANWVVKEDGYEEVVLEFIYTPDNDLDTAIINLAYGGYEVSQIYDITEMNGMINRVVYTEDYGGYSFVNSDREIFYDADNRIEKISEYDIFYNTGAEIGSQTFTYNEDRILSRAFFDAYVNGNNRIDTVIYDVDGKTDLIQSYYLDNPLEPFLQVDYQNPIVFEDELFIGPLDFYMTLYLIFDEEYFGEMMTLLNNDIPEQHVVNSDPIIDQATWYFSLLVNNKETEIPATYINIYPNPTSDFINVNIDEKITEMSIFNLSGELVLNQVNEMNRINIQSLMTGSYLVVIKTANGNNYFSKVVKQ